MSNPTDQYALHQIKQNLQEIDRLLNNLQACTGVNQSICQQGLKDCRQYGQCLKNAKQRDKI